MKVILPKLEYKLGETLTAEIDNVVSWAAVLLKDPQYIGHDLRGIPVLLTQSGLPNNTPTQLKIKLKWGGWMTNIIHSGMYLLKVVGFDAGNSASESDNFIRIV